MERRVLRPAVALAIKFPFCPLYKAPEDHHREDSDDGAATPNWSRMLLLSVWVGLPACLGGEEGENEEI
jgi:hypothetical protein